jgi:hypothetical protein
LFPVCPLCKGQPAASTKAMSCERQPDIIVHAAATRKEMSVSVTCKSDIQSVNGFVHMVQLWIHEPPFDPCDESPVFRGD